jgi:Ca2+-binding EF-hand superfamily protein
MALDEGKSGKIPLKELAFLLSNLGNQKGSTMSQKQFEDLLAKFNPDSEGKLDIEKLVEVLHDL